MNQTISMEEQDPPKQDIKTFLNQLETLETPEEKLKVSIAFMRESLAQKGTPNFKGFWDVRKICLPLFKESLPAPARIQLWADYIELTREGRRLKNLLDEETAFAVEQIDLAITALEKEIKVYHEDLEQTLASIPDIEFAGETEVLIDRIGFYQRIQKQLNQLNFFATRINALRKELIKTEMRIRQKNKFFQRLSQLGDQVFPLRKELIREVSEAFTKDVTAFVEASFSEATFSYEEVRRSVFYFRKEIKNLQAIAKILTLNTHAFSTTREMLSSCWDQLKGMEKELKKEFAEHRQQSSENAEEVKERIAAFSKAYSSEGTLSLEEGFKELSEISRWMREIQLTRNDVRQLKEALSEARQPLEAKQQEEEDNRKKKAAEFEEARRQKVEEFKAQVETLEGKVQEAEIETLTQELEECRKVLSTLSITKMGRQQLDRALKRVRNQIAERQEQALLDLSEDDRASIEHLETMLQQRKGRRKEIKDQIEEYRKTIGGSGLDIEKAMRYNELMENEKQSLAKMDKSIAEIKKKIKELKKQV